MSVRFIRADVFDGIERLRAEGTKVDLVMTSPPFLALRSYLPPGHPDKGREIGSEPTPAEFIDTMLDVVEALDGVLAPHGSTCFELGDTYSGSGGAGGDYTDTGLRAGQEKFEGSAVQHRRTAVRNRSCGKEGGAGWPLDKSLTFMPELFAASLAYGRNLLRPERTTEPWRVRNFVAWVRPNPPVGALGDKVRPATSYLTWACKARDRWFDLDAVRTEHKADPENYTGNGYTKGKPEGDGDPVMKGNPVGAPPLDWWKLSPGGYSGSHYAVYPAELCRIPIQASCPRRVCVTCGEPSRREAETTNSVGHAVGRTAWTRDSATTALMHSGEITVDANHESVPDHAERTTTGWSSCGCEGTDGIRLDGYHTGTGWRPGLVLDPFGGSGTTGLAASDHSRDAVLIDLDERNVELARERLGMFLTVDAEPVCAPTPEGAR